MLWVGMPIESGSLPRDIRRQSKEPRLVRWQKQQRVVRERGFGYQVYKKSGVASSKLRGEFILSIPNSSAVRQKLLPSAPEAFCG